MLPPLERISGFPPLGVAPTAIHVPVPRLGLGSKKIPPMFRPASIVTVFEVGIPLNVATSEFVVVPIEPGTLSQLPGVCQSPSPAAPDQVPLAAEAMPQTARLEPAATAVAALIMNRRRRDDV